ncbi:enoyl-CoA hydratase domain-containing protein [Zopfochytrium polystomum]|nr:enoyl-CoA hydratase domain-containing protein [Zopfochytrium polystomum]
MMSQLADHVDTLQMWTTKATQTSASSSPGAANPPFASDSHLPQEPSTSGLIGVIVTGEGGVFCSGFDLSTTSDSLPFHEAGGQFSLLMHDTLSRLRALPLVTVAAIDGYALGGGAELATSLDMRVIQHDAVVQFVQIKMGIVPGWQGGTRLTELLGRARALPLLAGAEPLSGKEAHAIGYASRLAPESSTALSAASAMLDGWAASGYATAIRGMKQVVAAASDQNEAHHATQTERQIFAKLWGARDNVEAIQMRAAASAARRKPSTSSAVPAGSSGNKL